MRGEQAPRVVFGRSQHAVDDRYLGHRERTVHGVQGAQQGVAAKGLAGARLRDPGVDRLQVALHFHVEDFQQQRIDAGRHGRGCRLGRRRNRFLGGRRRDRIFHLRRRGGGDRLGRHGLVAGGNPVGGVLQRLQVGGQAALATQSSLQLGQGVERAVDHRDHRRAGRTRAVEHAVEHVLDLPAELAQRARTDQPSTALEGMEHAPDRAQPFHVLGRGAPQRQQPVEVVDLLGEFLEEDLADLLVDFLADGLEAADDRRLRLGGRGPDCGGHVRWQVRRRSHGRRFRLRNRLGGGRGFDPGHRLHGLDGGRHVHDGLHRLGQRPVAQRLEAAAGDVEDLVAVAALLAQRLEVVLQARERVRQRVQLAAVGHALARDQFVFGIAADGDQVVRRQRQFHHPQRAGHLVEQARHVGQLLVLPAGLDEGDQRLPGLHEVGDGLAHDGVDHLLRLAGEQFAARAGVDRFGGAQSRHLMVERCIDIEQRTGHVQQCILVRGDGAVEDRLHRVALLLHHLARGAQAEHAERVGHAAERLGVRLQRAKVVRPGAQVQVERVLDVQQVVLHLGRDRIEQRAVASADAALGVFELGLGRQCRLQFEELAQLAQRGMAVVGMVGDVVEQLARRLLGRLAIGFRIAVVVEQRAARLALHAGEHLAQRGRDRQRTIGQCARDAGRHPQHALHGHLPHMAQQRIERRRQRRQLRCPGVLLPLPDLALQRLEPGRHVVVGRRPVGGDGAWQRTFQVRREQHAFAEQALIARGAQFVEQRQQHDRDIAVAALQALEVVGQQHDAAEQRRAGAVALADGAGVQRHCDLFHLLGHHRRGVQLDHAQRALHLVQVAGAQPHPADVGRIVDVVLQLGLGQAQRFVELGLDPAQRGVVEGFAQRSHRFPSRLPACIGLRPVVVAFIPCPGSVLRPAA